VRRTLVGDSRRRQAARAAGQPVGELCDQQLESTGVAANALDCDSQVVVRELGSSGVARLDHATDESEGVLLGKTIFEQEPGIKPGDAGIETQGKL
jgi:hypothetical protein